MDGEASDIYWWLWRIRGIKKYFIPKISA
jgi:hypothetical protein